ncbi:Beta-barrel assembly machine subunit BamA [Pseudoxanthobacter soli DSM 19599]|uniref:Outer membrane protein assembly factor BamA n=1 Tax=Pseudoxanthobacter soli DSM 19599 TaxID=1123029 RepID=A0A1M7ZQN3_9HYPH|nr:outer membrane protein assembly factor BamA [Pseudoxanthobacter soli]SHO67119.1 Beta-barrel assembly machine subunit BamA [Pseudoxanthobacter soli DSM 19599]
MRLLNMRTVDMMLRRLALAVALSLATVLAAPQMPLLGVTAAYADVVSRIVVSGSSRVDSETVQAYVTIKPGRPFGAADVDESLKALYATGLFKDVKISQQGGSLVVSVVENPIINEIAFEGNKRLSSETLTGIVESKSRSVLTTARVQSDVQRIIDAYRASGRYRATVTPKIIELPQNRVNLVFEINEGDKTGVSSISFVGNHAFSDGRLRDVIRTRETGLLGWLRTTDTYDPDRLASDEEQLRQFYYNHGYADFRVVSASAELDRERNTFFITFTVDEGPLYRFGDINVESSLQSLDASRMMRVVTTRKGSVYSAADVEKSIENLTIEASKDGYAFAQVRPRGDRDYENHTISITYSLDEGPRAYIERINIRGNTRTRDYVIRREFDVVEGDAYNRVLIDRAQRRLNNLGFFKTVNITTEPGSAPDRVIVNVDVEEQSTGEISFGVGYSTTDGVIGDISLTEKNFLGRGQYVRVAVGGGSSSQNAALSFTEPYFLGRRIAAGFDLYGTKLDTTSYRNYEQKTVGGTIRFNFPITEEFNVGTYYRLDHNDVTVPNEYGQISSAIMESQGTTLTSAIGTTFTYNKLDSNLNPQDGYYAKLTQEFAGLGGDVRYYKLGIDTRYYQSIYADWGLLGMLRAQGGLIQGIGDNLNATQQLYVGGDIIRGFQDNGIGPRDASTGDALGGKYFWAVTAEADAPMPYIPQELGLSWAVFTDAGSLWSVDKGINGAHVFPSPVTVVEGDDMSVRWTAGFGVRWQSPFGPLRADFAWPIMKESFDQTEVFRLSGGTRF